jgi:non-ribosomal peptide synthetase component F
LNPLAWSLRGTCAANPDHTAVRDAGGGVAGLTYRELAAGSETIASRLRGIDVPAGERGIACLIAGRSAFAAVAAMAAVSAGFAVSFVNPLWPESVRAERRRLSHVEIDGREVVFGAREREFSGWRITARGPAGSGGSGGSGRSGRSGPPDPGAFAVTTSGSTGAPRTVIVEQAPLLRLVRGAAGIARLPARATWSWTHDLSFDFSMWELWGCLLTGGTLVVASDAVVREPLDYLDLIEANRVEVLSITPRHLEELCLARRGTYFPARLPARTVVGGDIFPLTLFEALAQRDSGATRVFNMYGLSECCIHTTCQEAGPDALSEHAPRVSVGRALPGRRVRLVGADGEDVSRGEGELCVEGDGVSDGYLADPEGTRERFYRCADGQPGFRTRDLGVLDAAGRLFVTGRLDRQLKVRGMRVDPSEVEHRLVRLGYVESAFVEPCRGGLHAFVTLAPGAAGGPGDHGEPELLAAVNDGLPQQRLRHVHVVRRLPLNARGKPDGSQAGLACRDATALGGGHGR